MNRQTFRKRLAEREDKETASHKATPTLWKLRQSAAILREAIHDVLGAVQACPLKKKLVKERKEKDPSTSQAVDRMQWQLPKLFAVNAFCRQLQDFRTAESEWRELASTLSHAHPVA